MGSQRFFSLKKVRSAIGKTMTSFAMALLCQALTFFSFKHSCEGTVQVHKEFWAPASKSARTCWWPDYNRWDNELRCTVRKQCLFHGRRLIHRNNTINSDPLIWGYLLHYFTVIRKCFSRIFSTMEFQRILSLNVFRLRQNISRQKLSIFVANILWKARYFQGQATGFSSNLSLTWQCSEKISD